MSFGFRAASTRDRDEGPELVRLTDLYLLHAFRQAAVLTGHLLAADLAILQALSGTTVTRGIDAVRRGWDGRSTPAMGKAAMVDCGLDLPGAPSLADACEQAHITTSACGQSTQTQERVAAQAVQRALTIGLVCARHLGRYTWEQAVDVNEIMAATAWDCFAPRASTPTGGDHGAA
ncbi:MAG TPA: hypothetical protein VGS19_27930 [Streptosporangiaceae bacterium]|nr:hypothetical protein [Streptosporangiaceae bacterium]